MAPSQSENIDPARIDPQRPPRPTEPDMNADPRRFLPLSLQLGIPEIDAQHEALFAQLVALKRLCLKNNFLPAAEAEDLLVALRTHFAVEEAYAEQAQVEFSHHVKQHQQLFNEVSKALTDAVAGQADIFGVLRYIEYWFERHIAVEDKQLGARA